METHRLTLVLVLTALLLHQVTAATTTQSTAGNFYTTESISTVEARTEGECVFLLDGKPGYCKLKDAHGNPYSVKIHARVDGQWGQWQGWGVCSVTCGGGIRTRTRACDDPAPQNGGRWCSGLDTERQACTTVACKVNGNWGSWGSWSCCFQAVNSTRTRDCNNPAPVNGGADCAEEHNQTRPCSVNGNWGSWTGWGQCDNSNSIRVRDCNNPAPVNGGADCSGDSAENKTCSSGESSTPGAVIRTYHDVIMRCGNFSGYELGSLGQLDRHAGHLCAEYTHPHPVRKCVNTDHYSACMGGTGCPGQATETRPNNVLSAFPPHHPMDPLSPAAVRTMKIIVVKHLYVYGEVGGGSTAVLRARRISDNGQAYHTDLVIGSTVMKDFVYSAHTDKIYLIQGGSSFDITEKPATTNVAFTKIALISNSADKYQNLATHGRHLYVRLPKPATTNFIINQYNLDSMPDKTTFYIDVENNFFGCPPLGFLNTGGAYFNLRSFERVFLRRLYWGEELAPLSVACTACGEVVAPAGTRVLVQTAHEDVVEVYDDAAAVALPANITSVAVSAGKLFLGTDKGVVRVVDLATKTP